MFDNRELLTSLLDLMEYDNDEPDATIPLSQTNKEHIKPMLECSGNKYIVPMMLRYVYNIGIYTGGSSDDQLTLTGPLIKFITLHADGT